MSVLIDTSVIIAYYNIQEARHAEAVELVNRASKGEFGSIIISDYVFDETVTFFYSRFDKKRALEVGNWLLSHDVLIISTMESTFNEAWSIFQKSTKLSFTDCVLIVLAREKHALIATFDGHFNQFKDLRIVT